MKDKKNKLDSSVLLFKFSAIILVQTLNDYLSLVSVISPVTSTYSRSCNKPPPNADPSVSFLYSEATKFSHSTLI
jgi:hypothetical protein